jgi:hypothetical protein
MTSITGADGTHRIEAEPILIAPPTHISGVVSGSRVTVNVLQVRAVRVAVDRGPRVQPGTAR